jgi:membrane protein DedA with SNARE-associated domain
VFHQALQLWFHWVENWGYWGVFVLMAMESSLIPVPSEIVLPPAAFWAAQEGNSMTFFGVVLAGTFGSYLGSILNYGFSRWLGFPILKKIGKYFFISEKTLEFGAKWIENFGVMGVFAARLLPVLRHVVSIPAGLLRMRFFPFTCSTLLGAFLWCWILSWFGEKTIGSHPELLDSPEQMIEVMKGEFFWIFVFLLFLLTMYYFFVFFRKKRFSDSIYKNY